jgi:hypothetical protein
MTCHHNTTYVVDDDNDGCYVIVATCVTLATLLATEDDGSIWSKQPINQSTSFEMYHILTM